jgi:hypothetical protein
MTEVCIFTSALWTVACMSLSIKHVLTTAYHPHSNGMVDRMHRQIKDALQGEAPAWHCHLPCVLMGLHAVPKADSAVSSAELVTGYHSSYQASYCTCRILHMLRCRCLLRSSHQYASPYLMVSKGAKTLTVQVGQRQETISMDRLKAHTGSSPVAPAEAASRGRPPTKPATPTFQPVPS